ncbi:MAG TPA: glycosyl transferase, partial [Porphyromonadaceae bacterium]|nr:glycosyl transferase [Porphyromonadaceae bacterium]
CIVYYFDNVKDLAFPCPSKRISFFSSIDFESFDIIHTHTFRPDCYVWYHRHLKKTGAKFVSTLHQPLTLKALLLTKKKIEALIYFFISKKSHQMIDMNIVLSQEQYNLSIINLRKKSVEIIPNGRNIVFSEIGSMKDKEELLTLKNKYKIIGSTAAVIPLKGLEQIIKALVYLPEYVFVSIGEGESFLSLKQLSERLNVSNRCCWLGYRPDASNYQIYFDVFVISSRSEGFPLAFIEASAFGTPTVLSDIPILRAIATDEIVCFYQLDNISSLCEQIKDSYRNRISFSRKLRDYYRQCLTAETMANNYLKLYENLIKK